MHNCGEQCFHLYAICAPAIPIWPMCTPHARPNTHLQKKMEEERLRQEENERQAKLQMEEQQREAVRLQEEVRRTLHAHLGLPLLAPSCVPVHVSLSVTTNPVQHGRQGSGPPFVIDGLILSLLVLQTSTHLRPLSRTLAGICRRSSTPQRSADQRTTTLRGLAPSLLSLILLLRHTHRNARSRLTKRQRPRATEKSGWNA